MEKRKRNTETIRKQLLKEIYQTGGSVNASAVATTYDVSVTAIYSHLERLEQAGLIASEKQGRTKRYTLCELLTFEHEYPVAGLSEDMILSRDMAALLNDVSSVVRGVFSYVFTEMLNNAIDHSGSETVSIHAYRNACAIRCEISDRGVGIFSKIQHAMGLDEKRFAILELAKGKFTTDPASHTGEGVFFSSKVADQFFIFSDALVFSGDNRTGEAAPIMDEQADAEWPEGTRVFFEVALDRTITFADIANRYTEAPDDYGFSKTIVPVRLLEYSEANPVFVSRSQAKRLLTRFERFRNIVLDFRDVEEIGQGFADEVFRVFVSQHPNTAVTYVNAVPMVDRMIRRAQSV